MNVCKWCMSGSATENSILLRVLPRLNKIFNQSINQLSVPSTCLPLSIACRYWIRHIHVSGDFPLLSFSKVFFTQLAETQNTHVHVLATHVDNTPYTDVPMIHCRSVSSKIENGVPHRISSSGWYRPIEYNFRITQPYFSLTISGESKKNEKWSIWRWLQT